MNKIPKDKKEMLSFESAAQYLNTSDFSKAFEILEKSRSSFTAGDKCNIHIPDYPCTSQPTHANADAFLPKPSDIKLVAALGDSITAGFLVRGNEYSILRVLLGWPTEDRLASFPIGGDKHAVTLANIIKSHSSDVFGDSLAITRLYTSPTELYPLTHLNLAKSGARFRDMIVQAEVLIDHLKKSPSFTGKWKMINILFGANDACNVCFGQDPTSTEEYLDNLIQYLFDNVPVDSKGQRYVFVNFFSTFNSVIPTSEYAKKSYWCTQIQSKGEICMCRFLNPNLVDENLVINNNILSRVLAKWRAKPILKYLKFRLSHVRTLENISDVIMDSSTTSFLNPGDCFHPNECAHRLITYYSWNSMISGRNIPISKNDTIEWKSCSYYEDSYLQELK